MLCIGWVRNQRTTTALSVPHRYQSAHTSSSQLYQRASADAYDDVHLAFRALRTYAAGYLFTTPIVCN